MNAQPVTANAMTTPRTPATARWQGLAGSLGALGAGAACAVPLDVLVVDALGAPRAAAVVYLESAAARTAARPLAGYEIGQKERQFQPQVNVVTLGSVVRFPNRDMCATMSTRSRRRRPSSSSSTPGRRPVR